MKAMVRPGQVCRFDVGQIGLRRPFGRPERPQGNGLAQDGQLADRVLDLGYRLPIRQLLKTHGRRVELAAG